jgi:dolichyl-phosphate beta-glucosyltransferase
MMTNIQQEKIRLSVVVPAFNEAAQIESSLLELSGYLQPKFGAAGFEIIVVDDGSQDHTADLVRRLAEQQPWLRCIQYQPNRGKGCAVRTGMLAALGEQRLFCDADLSIPIAEYDALAAALAQGFDIAIGSKSLPGAVAAKPRPFYRRLAGRVFNLSVRSAGLRQFRDTQCGFKLFSARAAADLFARCTVDGFAFDVELLLLARGTYRVQEVGVRWTHRRDSRVSIGLDSARMFFEILRLRARLGAKPAAKTHKFSGD